MPAHRRKPARAGAPLSAWVTRVRAVVSSIPPGATASYARVALMAGRPGAARAVVRALQALDDVPWWRVVKSDGTVAQAMYSRQAPRLRREGVRLIGRRLVHKREEPAPDVSGAGSTARRRRQARRVTSM